MKPLRELVAELRRRIEKVKTNKRIGIAGAVCLSADEADRLLDAADENERLRALLGEARDALQWENPHENAELIERLYAELDK
jgi:hypothetical protein